MESDRIRLQIERMIELLEKIEKNTRPDDIKEFRPFVEGFK